MNNELLENHIDIIKGTKLSYQNNPVKGSKRYIQIEDLRNNNNLKYTSESGVEVTKNDLIIAWDGANAGTIGYALEGMIGSTLAILRPRDDKIYPPYLARYMQNQFQNIQNNCTGATIPHVNRNSLLNIKFPLPPLSEQKRIAAILDKADALRQKRRQSLQLLDEFLRATFLEMFGDPVVNPKNWKVIKLGSVTEYVGSGTTPLGGSKVYQKEGILFLRSQNVLMNKIDYNDIAYISNDIHKKMKRTWLRNNDVLLNITGASIGRVAVYKGSDNKANVNQHVCIIRLKDNEILPDFLSYYLSRPNYQNKILNSNIGATRQAFNFNQIKNFEIFKPDISLQRNFEKVVEFITNMRKGINTSEYNFNRLFNSLVQKAFRGEL